MNENLHGKWYIWYKTKIVNPVGGIIILMYYYFKTLSILQKDVKFS